LFSLLFLVDGYLFEEFIQLRKMRKSNLDIDECSSLRLATPLGHVMEKGFVYDFSIDVSSGIIADLGVIIPQIITGNAPGVFLLVTTSRISTSEFALPHPLTSEPPTSKAR
jgi:hypothetical protein